jgi:predicted DNA-binding ribbon-helix-helix protein
MSEKEESDMISRTIRISRELWRKIKVYAANNDLTISELISELIEDGLTKRLKGQGSRNSEIKFNFEESK